MGAPRYRWGRGLDLERPADHTNRVRAAHPRVPQTTDMRYLTDGRHLYEVAAERTVQNFGLTRGSIRYVIIRDCVTEATSTIDELQLAALSEVCW
jgi:hypothetical protein